MSEIIYWMLNMSLLASAAGLVIILLRKIRKIPRRMIYLLWTIPFLRFVLPFALTSSFSFFHLFDRFRYATVVVWKPATYTYFDFQVVASNYMGATSYERTMYYKKPFYYKNDLLGEFFQTAFWIWFLVALILILLVIGSYLITLQSVKKSESDIKFPMVYGLFKQRIFIPSTYEESDRHYVYLHEQVHARRHDNLFRMLTLLIVCLHWYNPLAWLFLKLFYTDMELACDEMVYSTLSSEDKLGYAHAIINHTGGGDAYMTAFGGAPVKLRVKQLLSYRKMTFLSLFMLLLFLSVLFFTLLTNAG